MQQLTHTFSVPSDTQNPNYSQNLEFVEYTDDDNKMWNNLISHQMINLKGKAIPEFFDYLKIYNLPLERIPQLYEISKLIKEYTSWEIVRVEELIDSKTFFNLLAKKKFPSTAYIRKQEQIDLSSNPDIFHELFGHVTLLFDPIHAHYLQIFGEIALTLNTRELKLLQRLFWFTYEAGLVDTVDGPRIYGGSILSSSKESNFVIFGDPIYRKPFSLIDVLRCPYKVDQLLDTYFVLDNFQTLYDILDNKNYLIEKIWKAYDLGE